jgi:hypothetical protein
MLNEGVTLWNYYHKEDPVVSDEDKADIHVLPKILKTNETI